MLLSHVQSTAVWQMKGKHLWLCSAVVDSLLALFDTISSAQIKRLVGCVPRCETVPGPCVGPISYFSVSNPFCCLWSPFVICIFRRFVFVVRIVVLATMENDRTACLLELMVYWSSAGCTELERGHWQLARCNTHMTHWLNRLMSITQLPHWPPSDSSFTSTATLYSETFHYFLFVIMIIQYKYLLM